MRSSLREAGAGLIAELIAQCETGAAPEGRLIASSFHVVPGMDAAVLKQPLPGKRR